MRRLVLLLAITGCVEQPTYWVDVGWTTEGRSTTIPEDEIGARVYRYAPPYGENTGEWYAGGYDSGLKIDAVETQDNQTEICAVLQHKRYHDDDLGGISTAGYSYDDLSAKQCKQVAISDEWPHVIFELVFAP